MISYEPGKEMEKDACHERETKKKFWRNRPRSLSAKWKSIGARNSKVLGSIPDGDSEFFVCPTLVTRRKTSFSILIVPVVTSS